MPDVLVTDVDTAVRATCAEFFGRYRGGGRWSPPNRCDACPLREPCYARGCAPARDHAQLDAAREVFRAAARRILAEGGAR